MRQRQAKALNWDKQKTRQLFVEFTRTRDPAIRDELIKMYLNLVEYLARRFKSRGEPLEDLIQVGTIGLIKAIDRFDINREVEFTTYATPTIVGELKRYFRDKGWAIRVPRRLQELNLQVNQVIGDLTQELQRTPTIDEVAKKVGCKPEEVIEALETSEAYNFISLDGDLAAESGESFSLMEYIGEDDRQLVNLEDRASLAAALKDLTPQEQKILYLRFFKGLTQTEIANELNISQMHVSRLLRRTLQILRQKIMACEE